MPRIQWSGLPPALRDHLFDRLHQTLRVTPAMEALLSDHIWSIEELVGLLDRRSAVAA